MSDEAPKKELTVVGQALRFSKRPQVEPEAQDAVREFAVQSPAGYQQGNAGAGGLANQLGSIPSVLQYGSTAGEMANARRGACAACKHNDVKAWRKYVSDATNPGSTPEMRQTIATMKARIAMAGYGYERPDGSLDVDATLAAHGICRPLSDWVEGITAKDPVFWPVVVWREATCLGRETMFITSHGVKSFHDFVGGEQINVLTHTGRWKPAVVKSYGHQPLWEVVLGRGGNKQTVRATAEHRWFLGDGSIVSTRQLYEGTKLMKPPHIVRDWDFDEAPEAEQWAWCGGFIFGDGAQRISPSGKEIGSRVRLFGAKQRFMYRFEKFGFKATYPESSLGDPNFHLTGLMKRLPPADTDLGLLTAFVRGYLDADGWREIRDGHNAEINPFQGIQVTSEVAINFVRQVFPMVGAYIVKETEVDDPVTNKGERTGPTRWFSLVLGFSNSAVAPYIVRSVSPYSVAHEEVWCLEVQDDESFVLPSGVVTGNCPPTCRAGMHELKVVTPEKPLGLYVPIGLDEKKIGAKRYDEVLRAAQGKK